MAEELYGSLGFKPLFDRLEGERGNTERKLSFSYARLHAKNLGEDVTGPNRRQGNIVQAHITECVKPPSLHR